MGDSGTSEIPTKCKACVIIDEGPDFRVEVQDVDVPEPAYGQLLLKLNCTGLCGSDIHYCLGDLGIGPSAFGVRSPGHEGAGVVAKLGPGVTGWKVGDRAGVKPMWDVCHNCELCWTGQEQYCAKVIHTGMMTAGTYQQYILSPAIYTSRIPDGVPDEVAGPIMCSASTMHRAIKDSGLVSGDWVVFPGGGGGVGIQGVQLASIMGMRPIVIDSGEEKRKLVLEHGGEVFIDFKEVTDVAAKIKETADGIGAHGVLVTAWQSYKDSMSYLGDRVGGKVVCIGIPPKDMNLTIAGSPYHMISNRVSITGSKVGTMKDTEATLEYARRGLLKPIHEVRGLSQWAESVQQLKEGKVAGRITALNRLGPKTPLLCLYSAGHPIIDGAN
ncbi:hypothetical protein LTS10_002828 [Elasticomyces elasticus]|nr:hypothetical protein LTS10_002828 [Elasticomyces elasticus]